MVELTTFARKYGVRPEHEDQWGLFYLYGKSGYTPTVAQNILTTAYEQDIEEKRELYQRDCLLFGFNARELELMGALPDPDAQPTVITGPIHPILDRDRWEPYRLFRSELLMAPLNLPVEHYSLGNDNTGIWAASNPVVWRVLDPVLRLVTKFLSNFHVLPWLHAFLTGEFKRVPEHLDTRSMEDKQRDGPVWTFNRRNPPQIFDQTTMQNTLKYLENLGKKLSLGISKGFCDPRTNIEIPGQRFLCACATSSRFPKRDKLDELENVEIYMSHEALEPLLRNDMSPSEILAEQFVLAASFLHEIGHATNLSLAGTAPWINNHHEPYYESEVFSELGASLELNLFGGVLTPMVREFPRVNIPRLGIFLTSFPSKEFKLPKASALDMYIGGLDNLPDHATYIPIISKYFEHIQQDSFWDCAVGGWGLDIVRPYQHYGFAHTSSIYSFGGQIYCATPGLADSVWRDSIERVNKDVTMLMKMNKEELEAYTLAKQLDAEANRRSEQARFRTERSKLAQSIIKALSDVEETWRTGNTDFEVQKEKELLSLLSKEAEEQTKEVLEFVKVNGVHDPKYTEHKAFLRRMNRHLRTMLLKFRTFAKEDKEQPFQKLVERMTAVLEACSVVLQGGLNGVMPANIEEFIQNPTNDAQISAASSLNDHEDVEMQEAEINVSMEQAKTAVETNDQKLCSSIGATLLHSLSLNTLSLAIACILLAHVQTDIRRASYAENGASLLEKLKGRTYDRNTLAFWGDIVNTVRASIKNEAVLAPCGR